MRIFTLRLGGPSRPRISLTALSTASRPISEGNCATDADIVPAAIALRASSTASKPITRILPVLPAAAIASTAPSAIMSLQAKTASISGCACSMFWKTVKPWSRSQLAVCEATTSHAGRVLDRVVEAPQARVAGLVARDALEDGRPGPCRRDLDQVLAPPAGRPRSCRSPTKVVDADARLGAAASRRRACRR